MPKRVRTDEPKPNKKPTTLVAALRANRMTPSGYQKVDVMDTLIHALRNSQVERAAAACRELECDEIWTSLLSFCLRESPNSLDSVLVRYINFQNNRPSDQSMDTRDMGDAIADICATEHDTEPFCSLLLSSTVTSLIPPPPEDDVLDAFVQLGELFDFGDNWIIEPTAILLHFWTSFHAMDVQQCTIAALALFKLQEEGLCCMVPEMTRSTIMRTKKIMRHWMGDSLHKPMIRHLARSPMSYLYVLMSACMAQASFKTKYNVSTLDHGAAHCLLMAAVENLVLHNKFDPVQTCVGVCCAIFNIFRGVRSLLPKVPCPPINMHEWTNDVQAIVQRRTLTIHRQLRHIRPLEKSVPELAAALTPSQINMSHDLAHKYTNLVFFDEMVGHASERLEECRAIYHQAITTLPYVFDVRKPYTITRFLLSELGNDLAFMYTKFT